MSGVVDGGRWSLTARIVLLAVSGILLASLMVLVITFRGPPPVPPPTRLSDVAAALLGKSGPPAEGRRTRATLSDQPPEPRVRETADPARLRAIAQLAGVAPDRLRLWYVGEGPGMSIGPGMPANLDLRGSFTIGLLDQGRWRVIQSAPEPLIGPWQRTTFGAMAAVAAVLALLAWLVARAISQPLSYLAEAAHAISLGRRGATIPLAGPPEVRAVAGAMNDMQDRLALQMASKTDMLAAIAHDLGTPLARLAFLVDRLAEPDRERAEREMAEMRAMIGSVIDFARHDPTRMNMARVEMAPLVREVSGDAISLSGDLDVAVRGDALALRRLVANLVGNARRYATEPDISLYRYDDTVLMTVSDNGPGIAPDLLGTILEPFARGEPSRNRQTGGAGLGLAIVRNIAEAHGGSVTVRNRATGGLDAIVTLPLFQS